MKSVIICGGGYSIQEGINLDLWSKLKSFLSSGLEIWSINYAFLTMPYLPHREVWIDISFFKNNIEKLQNLYKQGVKCYAKKHNIYATIPEIITYECTREANQSKDKIFIGRMGLSGFFALHLACKETYSPIYLLGFDFGSDSLDNKLTHYYQNKLQVISTGVGKPSLYRNEKGQIKDEIRDFELFLSYPSKIYNVSLNSNIPYFQKISYEEFFKLLENEKV